MVRASGRARPHCVECGRLLPGLLRAGEEPPRCAECRAVAASSTGEALPEGVRLSTWWRDQPGGAGMAAALGAIDAVFNPAAARAREQAKGDHERQVPKPSPGDDALRSGSIVIRRPPPDVQSDAEE